jgi:hypothetical protein
LSPLALLGALPLVAWAFPWLGSKEPVLAAVLGAGILGLVAAEVWFRGLVHGLLVLDFPVQHPRGPWRLSRAAWVSAAAYALVATVVLDALAGWALNPLPLGRLEVVAGLAAVTGVVGLVLAVIRERSLSLVPGIVLQALGVPLAGALVYAVL